MVSRSVCWYDGDVVLCFVIVLRQLKASAQRKYTAARHKQQNLGTMLWFPNIQHRMQQNTNTGTAAYTWLGYADEVRTDFRSEKSCVF